MDTTINAHTCAICLEEMVEREGDADVEAQNTIELCTLKCSHKFHLPCITPVIVNSFMERKSVQCPLCRNVECCTSTSLYQGAYNSLIDLMREEGRDETIINVNVNVTIDSNTDADTETQYSSFSDGTQFSCKHCLVFVWFGVAMFLMIGLIVGTMYAIGGGPGA